MTSAAQAGCHRSHTFHCLLDPISFLSTGVREDGNLEYGQIQLP